MAQATSRNEPLLDFAANIAKSANMLLQISGNDLRVINRIQSGAASATVRTPELLSLSIAPAFPIKKVYSEYEFNQPYPDSNTLLTELKVVEVKNLGYGESIEYDALSTVEEKVIEFLRANLISESAPICTARIFGIKDNYLLGYRIICIDEKQSIKATITITSIIYSFDAEETTISGPTEIEFVRNE
jgi:hypothetical protein